MVQETIGKGLSNIRMKPQRMSHPTSRRLCFELSGHISRAQSIATATANNFNVNRSIALCAFKVTHFTQNATA